MLDLSQQLTTGTLQDLIDALPKPLFV
jgi:hypothetical protein